MLSADVVIFSDVNMIGWFLIDEYRAGHTAAWDIPGAEDLRPYINGKDKAM